MSSTGLPSSGIFGTVADLQRFAREELGISLGQLAIGMDIGHPSVHVAIVGTRSPAHVDEAVAAADIELSEDAMRRIDEIVRHATPIAGPSPETV